MMKPICNPSQPAGANAQTRRSFLRSSTGAFATAAAFSNLQSISGQTTEASHGMKRKAPEFRYCLNTSTINGSKVPVSDQLQIAAKAGYDSVELWLRDIDRFLEAGGTTAQLRNQIEDLGLAVDSAIAFGQWIVDDDAKRKEGLDQCKRDMEIIRDIGGHRLAAPPSGATREPPLDLRAAADRYHALLEVGKSCGVVPQVELWGFSSNLSTLAEVLFVAAGANHADACILLDVYHLYKGGSDFSNIGLVPGAKMYCLHMNDYPAVPGRSEISDKDRVYPGDGIAPIGNILQTLAAGGFQGTLSLELFNPSYWEQPAAEVANIGLQKMKKCVREAFV